MTQLPEKVINQARSRVRDMKAQADIHRMDALVATTKAETLHAEALRLEVLCDAWESEFGEEA
jgi:hypothetical protein